MPVAFSKNAIVAAPGQQFTLGELVAAPTSGALPQYLVLAGLDRDRYTAASNGDLGELSGNGKTLSFHAYPGSDCAALGLVFEWTAKGYINAGYGYLAEMKFASSTDAFRSEYLSLYGFGNAGTADQGLADKLSAEVAKPFYNGTAFMDARDYPASAYLGSLDIVTRSGYMDATPDFATPGEIAAVAASYVGKIWNDNGCWVLASNIAASAGASLPLTANQARTDITTAQGNGEWIVAYSSAGASAAAKAHWQQMLRPGDIVVSNNSCGGHITTVVGSYGYAAQFIDNSGDSANDGSAHDIVVTGAHDTVPWAVSADPDNVVVYRLDTPVVTALRGLAGGGAIASLFAAADPAGKAIASYQVYATAAGSFTVDGATFAASSAANALTLTMAQMTGASFSAAIDAGTAGAGGMGTGALMVRAFNGSYWGDWTSVAVAPTGAQPPMLRALQDTVFLHGGKSLALSSLLATPVGEVDSYTITWPAGNGMVQLNGATALASHHGTPGGADYSVTISASDFAKLTFSAGIYTGGDTLTVTAHNASTLDSVPVHVTVTTLSPSVHGVDHWVATGADVPLTSLFSVTLPDATPVQSYSISTNVRVIDWGSNTPSHGGTIALNGAVNLLAGTGAPAGEITVSAADLAKVTLHAAGDAGVQFIEVWANDGAMGAPGLATLTTVAAPATVAASSTAAPLHAGQAVALARLLVTSGAGQEAPQFYRIHDPDGGGMLQIPTSVDNLQSKSSFQTGLFVVRAADFGQLAWQARTAGAETLTVSTSTDMLHWSAETAVTLRAYSADETSLALLYQAAFDRKPDTGGLAWWADAMARGATLQDAAREFAGSAEFASLYGAQASDADYLGHLYQNVLHRSPDAGGYAFWLDALQHGVTRDMVLTEFAQSAENRVQVVGVAI